MKIINKKRIPVSIIIPSSVNRYYGLYRCLYFLYKQKYYFPNEILIVFDNNNINFITHYIIKNFKNIMKRTKIKILIKNFQCISIQRIIGIKNVDKQSRYIMFCDDDDYYLPYRLKRHFDFHIQNEAEISMCNLIRYGSFKPQILNNVNKNTKIINFDIVATYPVNVNIGLFNKNVFEIFNFNPHLFVYEDYEIQIKFSTKYKIYFLNEVLHVYDKTLYRNNTITGKYQKIFKKYKKKALKEIYKNPNIPNLYKEKVLKRIKE